MASSAAICSNLHAISHPHRSSHHFNLSLNLKQRFLVMGRCDCPWMIRSMLNKPKLNLTTRDNGTTQAARVFVWRLFAQAQKLEEKSKVSSLSEDINLSMNLEVLDSDLQAAINAIRKMEAEPQGSERRVLVDHSKSKCTKQDLVHAAAACAKKGRMKEDLNNANGDLASQVKQIEDLKLLVKEQSKKISTTQFALLLKEDKLNRMRNESLKKNEEARIISSGLESRYELLNEANRVIIKQEASVRELEREVREKKHGLAKFLLLRKVEEEKLNIMEAKLEKQTVEWLFAKEELKELVVQASKHSNDVMESSEDFKRVRTILADVRSELISSQKFLASSRRKLEDQSHHLGKELAELDEQKLLIISYRKRLKDAKLEVERERTKLSVAHAQSKELELQLSEERELIECVQEELNKERDYLEHATREIALLQQKLRQKGLEFVDTLQAKESELVEVRLKIQHLKCKHASGQLIVRADLLNSQKKAANINHGLAEVHKLKKNKEDQLFRGMTRLQEKEEHSFTQHGLDTKFKFFESASVLQKIVLLTNKFFLPVKEENSSFLGMLDEGSLMPEMEDDVGFTNQKQLEIKLGKELHERKDRELLTAQSAPPLKDEELKTVCRRLDMREKEMDLKKEFREDANGLKKLYVLPQERIGDISAGDSGIEKLQNEVAELEAEDATSARQKLTDLSHQLLKDTNKCMNVDAGELMLPMEGLGMGDGLNMSLDREIDCLEEAEKEVVHLFALTEQLVKEAGIRITDTQQ